MALADHKNFDPLTFSIFMRWWMTCNGHTAERVSRMWGLNEYTIGRLLVGKLIPARNAENVHRFSRLFGTTPDFTELILLGRKDLVQAHIDALAKVIEEQLMRAKQ